MVDINKPLEEMTEKESADELMYLTKSKWWEIFIKILQGKEMNLIRTILLPINDTSETKVSWDTLNKKKLALIQSIKRIPANWQQYYDPQKKEINPSGSADKQEDDMYQLPPELLEWLIQ